MFMTISHLLETLLGVFQNQLWSTLLSIFSGIVLPILLVVFEQGRHKTKVAYDIEEFGPDPATLESRIVWTVVNCGNKVEVERKRDMSRQASVTNNAAIEFTFGHSAHNLKVGTITMPAIHEETIKYACSLPSAKAYCTLEPFKLDGKDYMLKLIFDVIQADDFKSSRLSIIPRGDIIDVKTDSVRYRRMAWICLYVASLFAILICLISAIYVSIDRTLFVNYLLMGANFLTFFFATLAFLYFRFSKRKYL